MSEAVMPLEIGATGSKTIRFSEPSPAKYTVSLLNPGFIGSVGMVLVGLVAFAGSVLSFTSNNNVLGWAAAVGGVVMLLAAVDNYHGWFKAREMEYVKTIAVTFYTSEVLRPVEQWLRECGLAVFQGKVFDFNEKFSGTNLYFSYYYPKHKRDAGVWARAYQVDENGVVTDSGKAYNISLLFSGEDTIEASFEVLDNPYK